jgi:hypothetical protein
VIVHRTRLKPAAAAAAALLFLLFGPARAAAQSGSSVTLPVSGSPVVRVQLRAGTLIVRTWNQSQVQVSSGDAVEAHHFDSGAVDRALAGGDIPIFSTAILSPQGPLILPAEDFPLPGVGTGHDGVVVRASDSPATVTVTIPNGTALLWAAVGRGELQVHDYRGGAFIARVRVGRITMQNVAGDGYVEAARGPIAISDSALTRVRARTAMGNILFENCTARQIEVSSILGSIAYDNGTFAPGLARFESQRGNVAIGIAGGSLQIGAHTAGGHIFEQLANARISGNDSDAQALLGSGGPVVTASSGSGNVYLYSGAFKQRRLPQAWRPVGRIIKPQPPLQQKFPHHRHI